MPKTVLSYRFPVGAAAGEAYTTDNGEELDVTGRFVLPPDIDFLSAQAIINAIGAVPLVDGSVCSDSALGKLRKLVFYRASGNTMSVAFSDKANTLTVASTIKGLLDTGDNNVVCIKLFGEEFPNLNDRMQLNYAGGTAISHKAPSTALKQNFLTGTINYTSESNRSRT